MERITHDLVQGSAEWLIHRAQHDNASDAAAMLNCSPYKTRNELLHERWLGMQPEFSRFAQERVLDRGHDFERLARPLAEAIMEEDLFPATMSFGSMSASMDGHTFDGQRNWEHKSLNAGLLEVMPQKFNPGANLPKHHRVQMEHQFVVSGATEALFTASKWNGEDLLDIRHAWYSPDYELRAEIIAGWEQFHLDLAVYQPPEAEKPKPAGKRMDQLPALHVTAEGRLTDSNLSIWKEHALSVIATVNRSLVSDEDFATAENMVKWCGNVEAACDSATAYIRSQVGTIDAALKAVEDVKAEAAKVRIELKTLGDRRKRERKDELVADAVASMHKHVADLNAGLSPYRLPVIAVDFAAQVKGKSKFANMKNDLDAELARGKIEADTVAEKMRTNIAAINAKPEFLGLFADAASLVLQPPEHLALVIRTRISDHEADLKLKAEQAAEAAREKIREEERAKAQAEADEKARAEHEAQEARAQIERDKQATLDAAAIKSPKEPSPAQRHAETIYSAGLQAMESGVQQIAHGDVLASPRPIHSEAATSRKADQPATVTLGKIAECLGFRLTEEFITTTLGIPCRRKERTSVLWTEDDYEMIRLALIKHLEFALYIPF